jgi:hypothetical protein
MDVGELERDAIGDLGLLAASRDEQEILLPVVEEPEPRGGHIRLRLAARCADKAGGGSRFLLGRGRRPAYRQVGSDLFQGFGGNPRAVAKPRNQLSVIDDAASERRFRCPRFAAKISDLTEDLRVHRARWMTLASFEVHCPIPRFRPLAQSSDRPFLVSTTIRVGRRSGQLPTLWDLKWDRIASVSSTPSPGSQFSPPRRSEAERPVHLRLVCLTASHPYA